MERVSRPAGDDPVIAVVDRVRRFTPGVLLIAVAGAWMSVTWMILMAAVVAIEKLLPQKGVATGTILLFIAALGLAVALAPGSVPGLTIPG
jgi:hypothetical protein